MNGKIVIRRKKKHFDLNEACEAGDMARVRTLVEEGMDLSEPWSHEEFTPLSLALYRNDVPMIAYLLEHGMPPYFNLLSIVQADPEGDPSDYSLLAPWRPEQHEALMFLLEHGSPANSRKTGYNALSELVYIEESNLCAKSDEFFAALLSREPDVDQIMDDGDTLLHQIAKGNNRYVPLLVARSKQVDAKKSSPVTPLRYAALEGADIAVEALLQAGANPNLRGRYQELSILDIALLGQEQRRGWRRHERVIELLRAHGAKTRAEMRKC